MSQPTDSNEVLDSLLNSGEDSGPDLPPVDNEQEVEALNGIVSAYSSGWKVRNNYISDLFSSYIHEQTKRKKKE